MQVAGKTRWDGYDRSISANPMMSVVRVIVHFDARCARYLTCLRKVAVKNGIYICIGGRYMILHTMCTSNRAIYEQIHCSCHMVDLNQCHTYA